MNTDEHGFQVRVGLLSRQKNLCSSAFICGESIDRNRECDRPADLSSPEQTVPSRAHVESSLAGFDIGAYAWGSMRGVNPVFSQARRASSQSWPGKKSGGLS